MIKVVTKMPRGLNFLYIIHAFSTFSFAILYSSLSLYLTQQLGFSTRISNSLVGLFLAFNYTLHLLGGLIGGRYLSNRVLFLISKFIQCVGIVYLGFCQSNTLYLGLSFFLVGCGLGTTCYNNILTQQFQPDDDRRETAFFLSYSAMNVGFLAGFIASGFFDYSNNYQPILYASVFPNLISIVLTALAWSDMADHNTLLETQKTSKNSQNFKGIVIIFLLIPFLILSFNSANLSNKIVVALSILMFGVILNIGITQKIKADKQKVMAFLILAITSIIFWTIYLTGPMGITLFIKNNVDKKIFNYELATQWIVNTDALMIVIGGPIVSIIINRLRLRGVNFSVTMQFVSAFLFLGLAFFFLTCAVRFSDSQGYSSLYWVILYFITQAIAELLIGPVGYALIGRIAPAKLQGMMMGTWMMVCGVAASLSHYFSNSMLKSPSVDPIVTNANYLNVFNQLTIGALIGGVFLYLISGKIKALIEDDRKLNLTTPNFD